MHQLANAPWTIIALIAVGWSLAWLIAMRVAIWHALRSLAAKKGQLAAVGFSITPRGVLVTFGPPLALLVLRAIASRTAG